MSHPNGLIEFKPFWGRKPSVFGWGVNCELQTPYSGKDIFCNAKIPAWSISSYQSTNFPSGGPSVTSSWRSVVGLGTNSPPPAEMTLPCRIEHRFAPFYHLRDSGRPCMAADKSPALETDDVGSTRISQEPVGCGYC